MEEGNIVFYVDNGNVYSGKVTEVTYTKPGFTFGIDSYGDCSGQYRISSDQIGRTVFLNKEDAAEAAKD